MIVAGVDSSSQSCTVELRDADDGRLLGSGRAPLPPTTPPVSEQTTDEWWTALGAALHAATEQAGVRAGDIAAISVAAQCHGAVLHGADGAATPTATGSRPCQRCSARRRPPPRPPKRPRTSG